MVAEHVSPPLKEEVKVTLKVSQICKPVPCHFFWSTPRHKDKQIDQAGFDLETNSSPGRLDLAGAAQSDGRVATST